MTARLESGNIFTLRFVMAASNPIPLRSRSLAGAVPENRLSTANGPPSHALVQ